MFPQPYTYLDPLPEPIDTTDRLVEHLQRELVEWKDREHRLQQRLLDERTEHKLREERMLVELERERLRSKMYEDKVWNLTGKTCGRKRRRGGDDGIDDPGAVAATPDAAPDAASDAAPDATTTTTTTTTDENRLVSAFFLTYKGAAPTKQFFDDYIPNAALETCLGFVDADDVVRLVVFFQLTGRGAAVRERMRFSHLKKQLNLGALFSHGTVQAKQIDADQITPTNTRQWHLLSIGAQIVNARGSASFFEFGGS